MGDAPQARVRVVERPDGDVVGQRGDLVVANVSGTP